MKRNTLKPNRSAFSLVEMLIVLSMVSVIVIAALKIHSQVRKAAAAVSSKIDNDVLPVNVLQRIAEDIDRLSMPGAETTFTINNKTLKGMSKSQLVIRNYYYDKDNKKTLYEIITWRAHYDTFEERTELLRSHGGLALEDSLLDVIGSEETATSEAKLSQEELQKDGKEPFIFICSDFSLFEFSVPQGPEKDPLLNWTSTKMPPAITAAISFAEPIEDAFGDIFIPSEQIYTRTIATDRIKKIPFQFVRQEFEPDDPNELEDPNELNTDIDMTADEIISEIEKPINE